MRGQKTPQDRSATRLTVRFLQRRHSNVRSIARPQAYVNPSNLRNLQFASSTYLGWLIAASDGQTLTRMVANHPARAHHAGMIEYVTDEAFVRAISDADLLAAYQRTDGECGEAEVLLAEIERRQLDI